MAEGQSVNSSWLALDWQPVLLSVEVALASLLLILAPGILAARMIGARSFKGREVIEGVLLLPLVLPPVATGYALLLLLGRNGVLGAWLESAFGWRLIFTPAAAALAGAVVAFPLLYGSAKAAFLSIDSHLGDAARALGASPWREFWTIAIPLAWPGLLAGAVLAFARALGEFGATIMVAGNISGQTVTMPTAIYSAVEGGDFRLAGIYSCLLGVVNLLFVIGLNFWTRRRIRYNQ